MFVYLDSAAQIAVVLLLAVVFLFITESLSPFAERADMGLYRWGNGNIISSMYVALYLKVDSSSEGSQSVSAFSGVLIAAHVFMILTVAVQSIVFVEGWNSGQTVLAIDRPIIRPRSSQNSVLTAEKQ